MRQKNVSRTGYGGEQACQGRTPRCADPAEGFDVQPRFLMAPQGNEPGATEA
ncbi:MAG: hypothetical protein GY809_00385 [Planctomycetes bacterium]|nr:hypothetical protein [Planctomycetota bacterium]